MSAPGETFAVVGDQVRIGLVESLRDATDGARPLTEIVQTNVQYLWAHGGRGDDTELGRQPEWIYLRPGFIMRPMNDPYGPVLPRLVKSKGLQLRLELLLLFDAQCRHAPGDTVHNVRRVTQHANDEYAPWRQLMLAESTPTRGTGRGPGDLRARQITEAMKALEDQHLLAIGREKAGGRRRYDDLTLLSEASTADEHPRYVVPERGVRISRHFFTSMWVFALTDTELAAFLALSFLRARFPGKHDAGGVYLRANDRENIMHLTRTTWRATELLHRFRLVDRARDRRRNFLSGKIGAFHTRWANREVMPTHFKINDLTLQRPAVDTIHQILTAPTAEDELRRQRGQEAVDEARALTFDPAAAAFVAPAPRR